MTMFEQLPFDVLRLIILAALPRPSEAHRPDNIRDVCRLVRAFATISHNTRVIALDTPEALAFLDCTAPLCIAGRIRCRPGLTTHMLLQHLQLSAPHTLHILLNPDRVFNGFTLENEFRVLLGSPAVVRRWASLTIDHYTQDHEKWLLSLREAGVVFPALRAIHITSSVATHEKLHPFAPHATPIRANVVPMAQVFPALRALHIPAEWSGHCVGRSAQPLYAAGGKQTWIDIDELDLTRFSLDVDGPFRYTHTYRFPALVALRVQITFGYIYCGSETFPGSLVDCLNRIQSPQLSFLDLHLPANCVHVELDLSMITSSFPLLTALSIRCIGPRASHDSLPVALFKDSHPLLTRLFFQGICVNLSDEDSRRSPLQSLYLSSCKHLDRKLIPHFLRNPHCLIGIGPPSVQNDDVKAHKRLRQIVRDLHVQMSSRVTFYARAPDRLIDELFYGQT